LIGKPARFVPLSSSNGLMKKLKVAWISDFPVEWLPDAPEPLHRLPRPHSMSWQRVLLNEFEKDPALDLHIFALRKNIGQDTHFERNGVSFYALKVRGLRAPSLYWLDTWRLKPHLQRLKPDLVHAWGTERGAALIAQRLGVPHVVTVQGLMAWYAEVMKLNFHEKIATRIEKRCLPRASLVTTESTFSVNFLKQRFPRIRVHQAEHAPNWLFHRVKRAPQTEPIRFIFIGLASERKGVDLLFAALEHLVDEISFELVLVGGADPRFRGAFARAWASKLSKRLIIKGRSRGG
jgi:glycosyltransferase involved in cell wall biosynthesis